MKGIAIVIISVVIVLFIRKFFNRKRKVVITSKEDQRKENQQQEKKKCNRASKNICLYKSVEANQCGVFQFTGKENGRVAS